MAAFIPIFIVEKVGRRPLMLFGVCDFSTYLVTNTFANEEVHTRPLECPSRWLSLQVPTIA